MPLSPYLRFHAICCCIVRSENFPVKTSHLLRRWRAGSCDTRPTYASLRRYAPGSAGQVMNHERYFRSNSRVLSTGQLHALLHFHLRPIYHLFCVVSFRNLILRRTSRLDAFSAYSFRTQLLSSALGRTTDSPLVRPSRSSRTRDSSSQISYAHAG